MLERFIYKNYLSKNERKDTNKMKMMKASKTIITGMIIATLAGGMISQVKAENVKEKISVTCETNGLPGEMSDIGSFDMTAYIKGMKFLSDAEKDKLIADERKIEENYKKIDSIQLQIDKISSEILKDSDELYDEINKIFQRNEPIWDKLYNNVTEEQNLLTDMEAFIKASNILSEEEKEILLADEQEAKKVDAKLALKYDELDKAIASPVEEENKIYQEIDDIDKENEGIWNKIWENQLQEEKCDPILY